MCWMLFPFCQLNEGLKFVDDYDEFIFSGLLEKIQRLG